MKRERFVQFALLIARNATAWAHDTMMTSGAREDFPSDALQRFDADIRRSLDRLKDPE